MHKEIGWALGHLANIYAMIRTDDNPPIEDPNQLKLFQDNENDTSNA